MKTLFILASVMVVLFLAAPNKIEAQKAQTNTSGKQSASVAQPGFYITLTRANCCGLVKHDSELSFRRSGYSAFFGDPHYSASFSLIESVDIIKYGEGGWNMLFVGSFQSESEAQRVVAKIPSILRKQITKDNKYARSNGGSAETMGFYMVEVSKVLSVTVKPKKGTPDKIEIAEPGLPRFRKGGLYRDVRIQLMKLGWEPARDPSQPPCDGEDYCRGFPEFDWCVGANVNSCYFTWRKKNTFITLYTECKGKYPHHVYYGQTPSTRKTE